MARFITLLFSIALIGCVTVPVENVRAPVTNTEIKQLEYAIAQSLITHGWDYRILSSGHFIATKIKRSRFSRLMAQVDVLYSGNEYQIKYKASEHLKYDGETIHKRYDKWITELNSTIHNWLSADITIPNDVVTNTVHINPANHYLPSKTRRYYGGSNNNYVTPSSPRTPNTNGIPVYDRDECMGAVIMGKCHGSILEKKSYRERCYGEMLNGKCTGPQF